MMKSLGLFNLFFGIFSLVIGSANLGWSAPRLRTGVLQLEKDNKLVLLGVAVTPETVTGAFNFAELGFRGEGLEHLDPKFILEVTPDGVTKVHAFELSAEMKIGKVLPPVLLDVPHAKRAERGHYAGNIGLAALKSLPAGISALTSWYQNNHKYKENVAKLQASYLLELIHKALPPFNKFPEFKDAIDPDHSEVFIRALGDALITRYNPVSNWVGMHVPQGDKSFFEEWRLLSLKNRSENKGYFLRRANELNLRVSFIEDDFAYVFIDSQNPEETHTTDEYFDKFMSLGSNQKSPQQILNGINFDERKGTLIPWYLVSFVNNAGPVDLINFVYPEKFGKELQTLNTRDTYLDISANFIPFSNWIAKAVNYGVKKCAYEKDQTKYLKRMDAYGSLLALTETEAYDPIYLDGIAYREFEKTLKPFENNFRWGNKTQAESLSEITATVANGEERLGRLFKSPSLNDRIKAKTAQVLKLRSFLEKLGFLGRGNLSQFHRNEPSRSPCGNSASAPSNARLASSDDGKKPVIIFMLDGLRPDRFKQAAAMGLLPNLAKLFFQKGVELESYTYRSLTLPSWSSFLSGKKPDSHGVRSNTPASRDKERITDNFQDPRKDFLAVKNRNKNRAYQRVEEDTVGEGRTAFTDFYDKDQVSVAYMPVVKDSNSVIENIIKDFIKNRNAYFTGVRIIARDLDIASAATTADKIRNDKKGRLRLVMNWFAGVDEASHYNNRSLPVVYKEIDDGVGAILEAAKGHPSLKDATVILVSDHGHSGGFGPFDATSTVYNDPQPMRTITDGPLLAHTGFNMVRFLAGDIDGYSNYNFVIGTSDSISPKFSLGLIGELQLQPFKFTYPAGAGSPTALVDSSGDNLAQVYLKKDTSWTRLNYNDLANFPGGRNGGTLPIIKDLLNYRVKNIMVTDPGLHHQIVNITENHPINVLAMALPGEVARKSADLLGADSSTSASTREPVLVLGRREKPTDPFKASLILVRSDLYGNDLYRYIVLKDFAQRTNTDDDPLDYLGAVIPSTSYYARWFSDREWLSMARRQPRPTAIFSLATSLTLAPKFTEDYLHQLSEETKRARRAEVPDFVLIADHGFGFHSDYPLESDHGGLWREEVRNTLFVSSLMPGKYARPAQISQPVFNHDVMPTVLELAGIDRMKEDPTSQIQGRSFMQFLRQYE
jgi:hypothetical protein